MADYDDLFLSMLVNNTKKGKPKNPTQENGVDAQRELLQKHVAKRGYEIVKSKIVSSNFEEFTSFLDARVKVAVHDFEKLKMSKID